MYESQVLHNPMLRSDIVASKVGKQVPRDPVQPYALSRLMRMPLYVAIIDHVLVHISEKAFFQHQGSVYLYNIMHSSFSEEPYLSEQVCSV